MTTTNQNRGIHCWTRAIVAFALGILVGFIAGVIAVLALMIYLQAATSYAG